MFNKINPVPGSGDAIRLGSPEGGVLLLQPPGLTPGAMNRDQLLSAIWLLLREPGPATGYPMPVVGDFNMVTTLAQLNVAIAQFISATGIAPALSERQRILPVFDTSMNNGDYPLPPDLVSLINLEYTPAGQGTYVVDGLSPEEWRSRFGALLPPATGQPYYYRAPFAGYIRFQPMPSAGNAVGYGIGTLALSGTPTPGQRVTATLGNGALTVTTIPYVVLNTDTPVTIAASLSTAINQSAACTGAGAFFQPTQPDENVVNLTSLTAPGTTFTYFGTVSGAGGLVIGPTAQTNISPNGDTLTCYYSSLGQMLVDIGDTPGIPPQFHMALCYRVLSDFWLVKQDFNQSKAYEEKFKASVAEAKAYVFDRDQSSQFTLAGDDTNWSGQGYTW